MLGKLLRLSAMLLCLILLSTSVDAEGTTVSPDVPGWLNSDDNPGFASTETGSAQTSQPMAITKATVTFNPKKV
jgi:hypothetical protein